MNTTKNLNEVALVDFDWDDLSRFSVNKGISTLDGEKIYCHGEYAQSLYDMMTGSLSSVDSSKDLRDGASCRCNITAVFTDRALAQTNSGQTVYIDLDKERRDAEKLGILWQDIVPGSVVEVITRNSAGTYYGSIVDCFIESTRIEFYEQIQKETIAYEAKVESVNRGGYIVDVQGIKCFLPGSLAAANKITDFESYVGKVIYVMIDGYVPKKDIFVVSYKKYLHNIMDQKIQELDLTKKYKGYVTGKSNFGLFVEWEDVYTGLLHKTEFDNNIVEGFSSGDEIEFYIKEVKDDNRLTLTFGEPVEKTLKLYEFKKEIEGGTCEPLEATVKHKRKNGALIELNEFGILALIPGDKLGDEHKNLRSGDSIWVNLYEVDPIMGKIFAEPEDE